MNTKRTKPMNLLSCGFKEKIPHLNHKFELEPKQITFGFSVLLFIFSMSAFITAQTVKIVWDNPDVILANQEHKIKVRPISSNNDLDWKTIVFDENKKNRYNEPISSPKQRYLYHPYIADIAEYYQESNVINLIQNVKNEAIINFTTDKTTPDDIPDFAFGYGLYFISIEVPDQFCPSGTPRWTAFFIPIDFRDSRYPYNIQGQDIEIHVKIKEWPGVCGTGLFHISELKITIPQMLTINTFHQDQNGRWYCDPIFVNDLFNQGPAQFNFLITNELETGLPISKFPTGPPSLVKSIYLTHDATFQGTFNMYADQRSINFIIEPIFQLSAPVFQSNRNIMVVLNGITKFQGTALNGWKANGHANNHIQFMNATSGLSTITSGLRFIPFNSNLIQPEIYYCDITLSMPISYISPSNYTAGYSVPTINLKVDNCSIITTDGLFQENADLRYACIWLKNTTANITNCHLTGMSRGMIIEGDCRNTLIENNIIENNLGHGVEFINLKGTNQYGAISSKDVTYFANNTVQHNKMYGAHLRDGHTNPYFYYNVFDDNGFCYPNSEAAQSMQFDAVNVFNADGVFQRNQFKWSGAYGLHAASGANPSGYDKTNDPRIPIEAENCFSQNYFNFGGNYASNISFGIKISTNNYKGHRNTFYKDINTRPPWPNTPTPWQVTINNATTGNFQFDYWVPSQSIAFPNCNPPDASDLMQLSDNPPCPNGYFTGGGGISNSSTHKYLVDEINAAIDANDWGAVKDKSILLLSINPDPSEATFAASSLITTYTQTNDNTILQYLYNKAMDRSNDTTSIACSYFAMKGYEIAEQYDISLTVGDSLALWHQYTGHWQMAYLHNAFIYWDIYRNQSASEELILSVLNYYHDAQTIGAYFSIMGKFPNGFLPKRINPKSSGKFKAFTLDQSYPNPFNPMTVISYSIPETQKVRLVVYDLLGKEITTLVDCSQNAGSYNINFNGFQLPSGVYVYRLMTEVGVISKTMMLLK